MSRGSWGTVFVVLGERHHWHAPTECWIQEVTKTRHLAELVVGRELARDEYAGLKILADDNMLGPWSEEEKRLGDRSDWDVSFTIHEREVFYA